MGTPESYDWGYPSEALRRPFHEMAVSVGIEIEITPQRVEMIALLSGMSVAEISQQVDQHIERGTE